MSTFNRPEPDPRLVACPGCDLLQRLPEVPVGSVAHCKRCDLVLWRRREDRLDVTLALTLTAAILFVIANSIPMLGLRAVGHEAFTTVAGGALHLWENGQQAVALLVLGCAVVAPGLQIAFLLAILAGARRDRAPAWVGQLLRFYPQAAIWSMIEVMMLGVLVALIKIAEYASVIPGLALYLLGALILLLAACEASLDKRLIWTRVRWATDQAMDEESPGGARRASAREPGGSP